MDYIELIKRESSMFLWEHIKILKFVIRKNLKNVSMALKNVKIIYADYRESESFIDEKNFCIYRSSLSSIKYII